MSEITSLLTELTKQIITKKTPVKDTTDFGVKDYSFVELMQRLQKEYWKEIDAKGVSFSYSRMVKRYEVEWKQCDNLSKSVSFRLVCRKFKYIQDRRPAVYAWIETEEKQGVPSVLLVKTVGADMWTLPGGKIERGETPIQCIVREVKEELSINLNPTNAMVVNCFDFKLKNRIPRRVYRINLKQKIEMTGADNEITRFRWIRVNRLPRVAHRTQMLSGAIQRIY